MFCKRGLPHELIIDNDTTFSSGTFKAPWRNGTTSNTFGVHMFHQGIRLKRGVINWIAVRKLTTARKCAIQEDMYWYNTTSRNVTSNPNAPTNAIYSYKIRLKDIDAVLSPKPTSKCDIYKIGDMWVRPLQNCCNSKFSAGKVTGIVSPSWLIVLHIMLRIFDWHGIR